ncbi:MAG: aminotransferase class III-fold pyridoxal phosphate-dependent enzyme [Pseudobdellovibrionaceae bacterium]
MPNSLGAYRELTFIMLKKLILLLLLFGINDLPVYAADRCSTIFVSVERDFVRNWGVKLLKDDDKAFKDPKYLDALSEMRPGNVPYGSYHLGANQAYLDLYNMYQHYIEFTDVGSNLEVLRFTNTGTDANNALYELAEFAFFKRTGKKAKRPNLLYFGDPYGGTYGRIAEIGVRYVTEPKIKKQLQIPTPYTESLENHSPAEIKKLEEIENEALEFIRKQAVKNSLEIGGIFLEPMTTTKGLYFFRTEFLIRLRALADELKVPIIADEIFTGGGRTGKFWAFQHYGAFRPDLVTFGKGLGVSGIAQYTEYIEEDRRMVKKWRWPSFENTNFRNENKYPEAVLDNTSRVNPLQLIQALQILRRIVDDKLEKNAMDVGGYALEKMKAKLASKGVDGKVKGIGLLFDVGKNTDDLVGKNGVSHYQGRWSPPLTMTKEEFDYLLDPE